MGVFWSPKTVVYLKTMKMRNHLKVEAMIYLTSRFNYLRFLLHLLDHFSHFLEVFLYIQGAYLRKYFLFVTLFYFHRLLKSYWFHPNQGFLHIYYLFAYYCSIHQQYLLILSSLSHSCLLYHHLPLPLLLSLRYLHLLLWNSLNSLLLPILPLNYLHYLSFPQNNHSLNHPRTN